MPRRSWIAAAAALASLTAASWPDPPLSGRDFEFSADFKGSSSDSALQFSTKDRPPPGNVIAANPALYQPAVITLINPDEMARQARYIAFFEVSKFPDTADSLNDVLYVFPWLVTNMTVDQGSGVLSTSSDSVTAHSSRVSATTGGGEVRNATIQVWQQTDDLLRYINATEHGPVPMPLLFAIAGVFTNTTTKVSYGFQRSSIEFKVQNKTAPARCYVNANGAPIVSATGSATDCLPMATITTSSTAGASASAGSSKKNSAATEPVGASVYTCWAAAAFAVAGIFIF